MIDIIVFAAGTYRSTVVELAQAAGHRVRGYVDDQAESPNMGLPVWRRAEVPDQARPWALALAVGEASARRGAARWAKNSRFSLATLVHPTADVSESAELGVGCLVHSGALIWSNAHVGDCTFVSPGAMISHNARIGEFCHIAMGSRVGSAVTVESDVRLGMAATVMTGVGTVGKGSAVGAGAVVTRDVDPGTTVVGVPARTIRQPR